MPRATMITRRAAVKAERIVDTLSLDHRARELGASMLQTDGGLAIELALAAPATVNDGDALKLEDGGLVQVHAANERVLEVRAENPVRLVRAALLAGGAHAVAEADAGAFYMLPDDGLAEAIRNLGCAVTLVERPFNPDRLAVHDCCGHDHHDHGHAHEHHKEADAHGHKHGHEHTHEHAHAHAHEHHDTHAHDHAHDHKHGAGCGCGHDHGSHDHGAHGHGHGHK